MKQFKFDKLIVLLVMLSVSYVQSVAQNPDNMKYQCTVKVWFWTGVYWQDLPGMVYIDKSTDEKWIKITHGGVQKGVVRNNPEYAEGGGFKRPRFGCQYLMCGDNDIIYYFNIK